MTNPLSILGGASVPFEWHYDGPGERLSEVRLPNGMRTSLGYGTVEQDRQLASVTHYKPGLSGAVGPVDSAFDYQWDQVGRPRVWGQMSAPPGGGALQGHHGSYDYDAADQLKQAVRTEGGVETNRRNWDYDAMGNRTRETRGTGGERRWVANEFNQLTSEEGLQAVEVRGTIDRAAEVKVNGQTASLNGLEFSTTLTLPAGPHELPLVARQPADETGPEQTVIGKLQLTVEGGGAKTYVYDDNGNLRADGVRSYEWDAENRLVAVSGSWGRSEFTYDGMSRRVKITENGAARRFVWDGMTTAEERNASGALVKRFWGVGEERAGDQTGAAQLYYMRDHLGSLRAVADGNGVIRARYTYSEWGERSKVEGDVECDFGFTGHLEDTPSGITLAPYRAYDSRIGRWLSRDPMGENGGLNLHGYVFNNPVGLFDPDGFEPQDHHGASHYQEALTNHPLTRLANVNLETDRRNIFTLENHAGPHSSEYHQEVINRFDRAYDEVKGKGSVAANKKLGDVFRKRRADVESGKLKPYRNKSVWSPGTRGVGGVVGALGIGAGAVGATNALGDVCEKIRDGESVGELEALKAAAELGQGVGVMGIPTMQKILDAAQP